jgi:hypothetical protein
VNKRKEVNEEVLIFSQMRKVQLLRNKNFCFRYFTVESLKFDNVLKK